MSKELQKDEKSCFIDGFKRDKQKFITIKELVDYYAYGIKTEDIPHEVVGGETKILTNGNENEVLNVGEWKKV